MAGNPDVLELIEEMIDSGRTPEEVCRDRPELLPEVRRRWTAFRRVDGALSELFPDPEAPRAPAGPLDVQKRFEILPAIERPEAVPLAVESAERVFDSLIEKDAVTHQAEAAVGLVVDRPERPFRLHQVPNVHAVELVAERVLVAADL